MSKKNTDNPPMSEKGVPEEAPSDTFSMEQLQLDLDNNSFEETDDTEPVNESPALKNLFTKPTFLKALSEAGFDVASEGQEMIINYMSKNRDILYEGKLGTGKSIAIIWSILDRVGYGNGKVKVVTLVSSPDMAEKVAGDYAKFCKYMDEVKIGVFHKNHTVAADMAFIEEKKPEIVIGTPGRIWNLIHSTKLDVSQAKRLLADDITRMWTIREMIQDAYSIFMMMPCTKQVILFGTEFNQDMLHICKNMMVNPVELLVSVKDKVYTLKGSQHYYEEIEANKKEERVIEIMKELEFHKAIIYMKLADDCDGMVLELNKQGYPSIALHYLMSKNELSYRYELFRDFRQQVLVTTGVTEIAMDLEKVDLVINYDIPNIEGYLRVVGKEKQEVKRIVISFVNGLADEENLKEIKEHYNISIDPLPKDLGEISAYLHSSSSENA